jgi:hypothetical protein
VRPTEVVSEADRLADTWLVRCGKASGTERSISGGRRLLCDRRRAGPAILMLLALTSRRARDYAVRGRRMPKKLTRAGQPPEAV